MTTPEPRSVELEPLVLSFDEDVVESEQIRTSETDTRELPAYSLDSESETLVGIGGSDAVEPNPVCPFDISDRTLIGIGPLEDDKQAEGLEFVDFIEVGELPIAPSHAQPTEATPESVPMPRSEPPGPFVSADDAADAPLSLPIKKSEPWLFALPAVLAAAAGVTAFRVATPSMNAAHTQSAAITTPLVVPDAARTSNAPIETAAVSSAESPVVDAPNTHPKEEEHTSARPSALAREKPLVATSQISSKFKGKEGLGALDLSSNPPASLVLDGRPLGRTPRVVQLSSGPHTVVFVHPERGRMSVTVNVRAGRTTNASANF